MRFAPADGRITTATLYHCGGVVCRLADVPVRRFVHLRSTVKYHHTDTGYWPGPGPVMAPTHGGPRHVAAHRDRGDLDMAAEKRRKAGNLSEWNYGSDIPFFSSIHIHGTTVVHCHCKTTFGPSIDRKPRCYAGEAQSLHGCSPFQPTSAMAHRAQHHKGVLQLQHVVGGLRVLSFFES